VIKAPFPYFGGKSRAAHFVWERFGEVKNYVEPFFGSGAVLLSRPDEPHTETVNDLDCMLANFWRALQHDPEAVALAADWPVNEADMQARHLWLTQQEEFRERMKADPDYFDAKIAGWWVWGISAWIGGGWCRDERPSHQVPCLSGAGMGVHRQLPSIGSNPRGVHAQRCANLVGYFNELAARLRRVRVCCGDWKRVTTPCVTFNHGLTGVFLDPPYADTAKRTANIYAMDSLTVAHEVREWAIANGDNPKLRIALCGYEGEHQMPDDWACVPWKAPGGYARQRHTGPGMENAKRERIWFSPHCLAPAALAAAA
jgi:site-specific DNA-adenine methylase